MPRSAKLSIDSQNSVLQGSVYRIPPFYYIHVLDQTSNITKVQIGPKTYIKQENEVVILGPVEMIIIPPNHYCIVRNPVIINVDGILQTDKYGQAKLRHADLEVRLTREPFPLYPGEILHVKVEQLEIVPRHSAMLLKCHQDFLDGNIKRIVDDEWLFEGPGIYIPRKEVTVQKKISAIIVKPNQALKLRALLSTCDKEGHNRMAGEEWLVKSVGSYILGAYEELVEVVSAHILTNISAIHIKAVRNFIDQFGKNRKNGEEWLVTKEDTETYIPDVYAEVTAVVPICILNDRQYCVIMNPVGPDGRPQLGQKKLIVGKKSFFLNPGEACLEGIQNCYVLDENEGLVLKAVETFKDDSVRPAVQRKPGDKWLIRGPMEYIPPVEVEVIVRRKSIPLDKNEGIYVRNLRTGKVIAVFGETYMLDQDEELWEKDLPKTVKELLKPDRDNLKDLAKLRKAPPMPMAFGAAAIYGFGLFEDSIQKRPVNATVVSYRVPHNSVVQIYDYKEKIARVIYGPDLILLSPDEHFTELSLSGSCPKKPHAIRSLCLYLGPDFCTDRISVETADHARLLLQLAYNWHFDISDKTPQSSAKLFSVPDFVGDLCKAVASRVRAAVACTSFDDFHKHSAQIIRSAVFGYDENKKIRSSFIFPQNKLFVTSVDIQGVEPVDERTRDALLKSVQLAIEITTQSLEATAKHEALRSQQEAQGKLMRQRIDDEIDAEKVKRHLLELQADNIAVEGCGQAKAEALSRSEACKISGDAAVEQALLKGEASKIEYESGMSRVELARELEIVYLEQQNELQVKKAEEMYAIEINKFREIVKAIGSETIEAIALAGPELQVKLLQGLGLKSTLLTDGKTPLNLFTTASGLIGRNRFDEIPNLLE